MILELTVSPQKPAIHTGDLPLVQPVLDQLNKDFSLLLMRKRLTTLVWCTRISRAGESDRYALRLDTRSDDPKRSLSLVSAILEEVFCRVWAEFTLYGIRVFGLDLPGYPVNSYGWIDVPGTVRFPMDSPLPLLALP